jgi:hypothetical protein
MTKIHVFSAITELIEKKQTQKYSACIHLRKNDKNTRIFIFLAITEQLEIKTHTFIYKKCQTYTYF